MKRTSKIVVISLIAVVSLSVIVGTFKFGTAFVDNYEPNETFGAAYYFGIWEDWVSIDSSSDLDYYSVYLNVGENVSITIWNMTADLDLILYYPNGTVIMTSAGVSDENVYYADAFVAGSYVFYVYGYSGAISDYTITSKRYYIDDFYEPNDLVINPWIVSIDTTYPDLRLCDDDFFAISLNSGAKCQVDFAFLPGAPFGMTWFTITGPDQVTNLYQTYAGTANYEITASSSGYYYINVTWWSGDNGASYTLSFSTPSVNDDVCEPNDLVISPYYVSIDTTYYDLCSLDDDFFAIWLSLGAGCTVNFTLDPGATFSNFFTITAPDQATNLYIDYAQTSEYTIMATSTGFYYINITWWSGNDGVNYTLSFTTPAAGGNDDIYEDNEDPMTAPILVKGTYNDLASLDDDFYAIVLSAGASLTATITRSGDSTGYLILHLMNSTYVEMHMTEYVWAASSAYITLFGLPAGTYYVALQWMTGAAGNYSMDLSDGLDDPYEDFDSLGTALDTDSDIGMMMNLVLMDEDWLIAPAHATDTFYAVAATNDGATASHLAIQLTNNVGTVLASSETYDTGVIVNYSVPSNMDIYIRVYQIGGWIGEYIEIWGYMNISHPTDISYNSGETGHLFNWTLADPLYGDGDDLNYDLFMNGGYIGSDTWNNTENVIFMNVDGFPVGVYTLQIVASNALFREITDTITITVTSGSNTVPVLDHPADIIMEEGELGYWANWTVTDPDFGITTYQIYYNGTPVGGLGSWETGVSFGLSFDGISAGVYEMRCDITDGLGGTDTDTMFVTVNVPSGPVAPSLNAPEDISYEYSDTGNIIGWSATDSDLIGNGTWYVYWEDINILNGPWTSGSAININVDGISIGVYNCTVIVIDEIGLSDQDTVWVTVYNVNPLINSPTDVLYEVNDPAEHWVNWTISDASVSGGTYIVYINDVPSYSGAFTGAMEYDLDVIGLGLGNHNCTIKINDGLGGISQDTAWVTVYNVVPYINAPPNLSFEANSTSDQIINWISTDNSVNSGTWVIKQDDVTIYSGAYTGDLEINLNVTAILPGVYNFTLIVNDGYGGIRQDSVIVTISNVNPNMNSPQDLAYIVGNTGNIVNWTVSDQSYLVSATYTLYRNEINIGSGTWPSGNWYWEVVVDGFGIGDYNYTLIVTDGYGAIVQDTVWVHVIATNTIPTISTPADISYNLGATGNFITWTITDPNVNYPTYQLFRNLVSIQNSTWPANTPFAVSVDGLVAGTYIYVINASDGLGGIVNDTVIVTVIANANPVLTAPKDITYVEGAKGNNITWTVTDNRIGTTSYTVKRNGTIVTTGTWISGDKILISVDGLTPGSYGYEITISDGLGGTASDKVIVTVTAKPPAAPPTTTTTEEEGGIDGFPIWIVMVNSVLVVVYLANTKKNRKIVKNL